MITYLLLAATLFRASFDNYTTTPDFAAGGKTTPGGIQSDLQMRMNQGEGTMKNVLSLTNPECVTYKLNGNFRPDRGTVSFWVRPANYTLADIKTFQMFFRAEAANYTFLVYKYPQRPDVVLFYLKAGDIAKFVCGDASKWRAGDWHKVDVTWDPNGMQIYLDGLLSRGMKHVSPLDLPHELKGGMMSLNRQEGFNPTVDGRETGYDALEIYDCKLSAKEIFENYRKVRPNAKPDANVDVEPEPPRLTYRCLPKEKKLAVKLDIWSANLKKRENVPVILSLVNRENNEKVVKAKVVFADPDDEVDFVFGDQLKSGAIYDLVAEIPEAKTFSKARFMVPDMSFLNARPGRDGSIPPPWSPVKVVEEGVYSLLDRTYTFKRGILPTSVISRGEEMLTQAPNFELNGKAVDWEAPRLVKAQDDRVVLAAQGRVGDVIVRGRADLWFDGFCQLTIRFRPGEGGSDVSSLQLKWSVPIDAARYLLTPYYRAWQEGDRYDGRFGTEEYLQDQFLWTSGVEKGLCWWCESTANWVGNSNENNLHVVRNENTAEISVDIISKPVRLAQDADYMMGFQATPVKSPDRLDRSHWYSGAGSFGDWTTAGWAMENGNPAPDNMKNWTSYIPLDGEAFGKFITQRKQAGFTTLNYGQPSLLSVKDDAWDYFNASWCRLPYVRGTYKGFDKKPIPVYSCCGNTGAADWQIGNIERLFENYPDHGGLYFDICDVKFCNNTLHGHGGTDAFGQPYSSSIALASRDFFLRVYRLCKRYNRRLHVHAHNKYYPFVHTFADACWPGEEQYVPYAENPENHYLEGIGEEEYQAAWSPVIRGLNIYMIGQNHRACGFGENKNHPELFFSRRAVMTTMMPPLLYDFKSLGGTFGKSNKIADDIWRKLSKLPLGEAKFHGYWFDPHAEVANGIRTALYTWGKDAQVSFLLVVGNTSREALETALNLNWTKAGTKPTKLTDIVTGEVKTPEEWAKFSLPSHEFLLLVPEGTNSAVAGRHALPGLIRPDEIIAADGVSVELSEKGEVMIASQNGKVEEVQLIWNRRHAPDTRIFRNDWERGYTELGWTSLTNNPGSAWYFLIREGKRVDGWGVETQPNALCWWEVSESNIVLTLDVRAGGAPLELGSRTLKAARLIMREGKSNESAYEAGRAFCKLMCPKPRLPKAPVYGYNDWYCAYGENTATNFLADAENIVSLAEGLKNRPYVVMDDGWQLNSPPVVRPLGLGASGWGPWDRSSAHFGVEMKPFAAAVSALGAKPGLWYRPYRAWKEVPAEQKLKKYPLFFDPTAAGVKERIAEDIARFRDWGFKLVKIDYLVGDVAGTLAFPRTVGGRPVQGDRGWCDKSRTTAEVILEHYRAIRETAGDDMVIIGCNAFDHLVAGLFELQRTGGDTSGWKWQTTKEMGFNCLAARSIHDGTFYSADGDCVGLAKAGAIDWSLNRKWLEMLAKSGTPLFISWHRSLMTAEIRDAFKAAFKTASEPRPTGEPLDWETERFPEKWRFY